MSDLQLCGAKQLRKHEVGFIANKNLFFRETRKPINSYVEKSLPYPADSRFGIICVCTEAASWQVDLRKGGMPMDTFQTIMSFLAFGSFLIALLTYIEKRK
jgi:hypothetical protein